MLQKHLLNLFLSALHNKAGFSAYAEIRRFSSQNVKKIKKQVKNTCFLQGITIDFILSYVIPQCQEQFYVFITHKRGKGSRIGQTGILRKERLRNLTIQEIFIYNLKAYRKLNRISQTRLAELCNSSTGYIGEIECGRCFPSVSMIERIAGALRIESWHLFKNEPVNPTGMNLSTKLAPTQKKEILMKADAALSKILDDF
jgi:transcriptional regulator with XRE-family HTH domain